MRAQPTRRERRRVRRIALLIIGSVVAFVIGAGWWMWSNTVGYVPPPRTPPTQWQITQAQERIEAARQQVVAAGRAHKAERFRLEISEGEINAYLAGHASEVKGLREARVEIAAGNQVAVSGWAVIEGREVWITAVGKVTAQGPDLAIQVTDVKVGNLSVPGSVRDKYLTHYGRRLARIPTDLPVTTMQVATQPQLVIVTGVTR